MEVGHPCKQALKLLTVRYGALKSVKVRFGHTKEKQQRDSAIVSVTRVLHDEEYCCAFVVTNDMVGAHRAADCGQEFLRQGCIVTSTVMNKNRPVGDIKSPQTFFDCKLMSRDQQPFLPMSALLKKAITKSVTCWCSKVCRHKYIPPLPSRQKTVLQQVCQAALESHPTVKFTVC